MSGTALLEIQSAVHDALAADTELDTLVDGRIYDAVPATPQYPLVVLGEKSEKDFRTFNRRGVTATLVLDIRSQTSDEEVLRIYDRIRTVLHDQAVVLAGYTVVQGLATLARTVLDADGVTRRGEARYEVTAQETL